MDILVNATITPTGDGAALALEDAADNGHYRITTVGDTVVISVKSQSGRYERVDRLTEATQTGLKNGDWSYEGTSEKLMTVVGLPHDKSRVSFKASGQDGCPTCH